MLLVLPTLTTGGASYFSTFEADNQIFSDAGTTPCTDQTLVQQWSDTTSGKHLSQATGANKPTFCQYSWPNNRPCIHFDGPGTDFLQGSTASDWTFLSNASDYTIFMVWRSHYQADSSAFSMLSTMDFATTTVGLGIFFDNRSATPAVNKLTFNTYFGTSGQSSFNLQSNTSYLPRAVHCSTFAYKNAATATAFLYDWGISLGTVGVTHAQSASAPLHALRVGQSGLLGTLKAPTFDVAALIICNGNLNTTDLNAINTYLEAKWHPAGNILNDLCMDNLNQFSLSGPTLGTNPFVKSASNPIFVPLPGGVDSDTWDHDKYAPSVIKNSETDWKMYYGAVNEVSPSPTVQSMCIALSTDGINWTKPNIGVATYNSSTNNNMLTAVNTSTWFYQQGTISNPSGPLGQKYIACIENITSLTSTGNGCYLYGSENGINGWTLLKAVYPASGNFTALREPTSYLMRRNDGRWQLFYLGGAVSTVNLRYQGLFISDTTDITGSWTDWSDASGGTAPEGSLNGYIFHGVSNARQVGGGGLWINNHNGLWIGFLGILSETSTSSDVSPSGDEWTDIWFSRDEGLTWYQTADTWIPLAPGQWDGRFIYGASMVPVNNNTTWRIWYSGGGLHGNTTYPHNSQIGYGEVPYERLGLLSGTGTWTTRALIRPGFTLTLNANASGGSITAACLDEQGTVITGFADTNSSVFSGDFHNYPIYWNSSSKLPNQVHRIRFTMNNATIYGYNLITEFDFGSMNFPMVQNTNSIKSASIPIGY